MTSPIPRITRIGLVASCATSVVVSVTPRISASFASMSARVMVPWSAAGGGCHQASFSPPDAMRSTQTSAPPTASTKIMIR